MCERVCAPSLEVTLQKLSEGPMWAELVMGNRRGEYVVSDEQAALIHQRLTHLTSEDLVRPYGGGEFNGTTRDLQHSMGLISSQASKHVQA